MSTNQYQTIQKIAEDIGIDESTIRLFLKKGLLTKYSIDGFSRIFIDVFEFNSLIKPIDKNEKINLDNFMV